ncbi:MAG: hypothetical protein VCC04_14395, partial [Myxococcota bacterium]
WPVFERRVVSGFGSGSGAPGGTGAPLICKGRGDERTSDDGGLCEVPTRVVGWEVSVSDERDGPATET